MIKKLIIKGKLDDEMNFTGTAEWPTDSGTETRDYDQDVIEGMLGELLDAGTFLFEITRLD